MGAGLCPSNYTLASLLEAAVQFEDLGPEWFQGAAESEGKVEGFVRSCWHFFFVGCSLLFMCSRVLNKKHTRKVCCYHTKGWKVILW